MSLAPSKTNETVPTPVVLSPLSWKALIEARGVHRDFLILMRRAGGLWIADMDDSEAVQWTGLACRCHRLAREDGGPLTPGAVLHDDTVIVALEIFTSLGFRVALVCEDTPGHAEAFQFIDPARPRVTAALGDVAEAMGRIPVQFRSFAAECIVSWLEKLGATIPWNGRYSRVADHSKSPDLCDLDILTDLGRALSQLAPWAQRTLCRKVLDVVASEYAAIRADDAPADAPAFEPFQEWRPDDIDGGNS